MNKKIKKLLDKPSNFMKDRDLTGSLVTNKDLLKAVLPLLKKILMIRPEPYLFCEPQTFIEKLEELVKD